MNPPGEERRQSPGRRAEDALAGRIATLEGLLGRVAEDIRDGRTAIIDGLAQLDKRVVFLEDVRVRALEDWRLSQRVLEKERGEIAATAERRGLSRRERTVAIVFGLLMFGVSLAGVLATAHII